MRKTVIRWIGITALLCLQVGHAFSNTLPPSPEDMAGAMRKVGMILSQPPLIPIPTGIPSPILSDANIQTVRFADKAGVALIKTQQEIEIVDLGIMKRIFRQQNSISPAFLGSMSPNGRLFTAANGDQLNIQDTRTGAIIAGIPSVLPWMFHWLDERTAFYVDKKLQSFFVDFASGKIAPTGLMSMPLSSATRIHGKRDQYAVLSANKVFKFELMRDKSMPELRLLAEKPVDSLLLASNTSGTTSDGKYFFDTRSHLTLINLLTLESETISLDPFYFQTAMAGPTPDNIVVTGFISPHDDSGPGDYLYSIRNHTLAQIEPGKQRSSQRRIYISSFRKMGIIKNNEITLTDELQTAEATPLPDFLNMATGRSGQNKIALVEKQKALEDSCHPTKEKNKDGLELHAIGIYEGPLGRDNSAKNKVDVVIYPSVQPIAIALFSYEQVTWDITLEKGSALKEIFLKTSDGIRVSGANSEAVKVTRQNIGSTAYEDCNFFRIVAPKLKEFSGLNATSFQGAYRGIGFPVRPQQQAGTAAIEMLAVSSKPITKFAPGLNEGLAAYARGDYRAALEKLAPLAEYGVAMAQNTLGKMYLSGQGVSKDYDKAMLLFRKAANQQLPNAQNNIGVMYAGGLGVPQDFRQAITWFEKAADQDFVNAMLNLVGIYESGTGVDKDPIAAEKWRHRAQGLAPSEEKGTVTVELSGSEQYRKGLEFYQGFRFREAFCHLLPAAKEGNPEAQLKLASMYRYGQGGEKDERQAKHWAEKGDARIKELAQAQNAVTKTKDLAGSKEFNEGLMLYHNGKEREAFCSFLAAAGQSHPEAQLKLSLMYRDGIGGRKDERQAQYWTEKAASKGYSDKDGRDRIYFIDSSSEEGRRMIPSPLPVPCGCAAGIPIDQCCK